MNTLARTIAASLLTLLVLDASSACTNNKLEPVRDDEPKNVDDLLEITAEYCTRPAEEAIFPVKILLVVDTSGSMQFTDQPNLRVNAVRELVNSFVGDPAVQVATMAFGSNVYVEPGIASASGPFFIPADQWSDPAFLQLKDVMTDYQGALEAIKTHLLLDMTSVQDPAELARTKYVVIFFSDGAPSPKCCIQADETDGVYGLDPFNCPLDAWEVPVAGRRYCENESEIDFCNIQDNLDYFRDGVSDVVSQESNGIPVQGQPTYGEDTMQALDSLEVDSNYNRVYQIEDLVSDVVEFADEAGVGDFRLHTALLFDDTLPDGVKEIYRLNKCRSESLLRRMAELGNGIFRDFESSEEIDFLSFNFTSLKSDFQVVSSYAYNTNALPPGGDATVVDYVADTDADGLSDSDEQLNGTAVNRRDSDKLVDPPVAGQTPAVLDPSVWGDGYNDKFEADRSTVGFDGRYQSLPLLACPVDDPSQIDRDDLDFDGLNGCEEDVLQTDILNIDTDGDTLPDGLEVRLGLDPLLPEEDRDSDFDGTPNSEEVGRGRDPREPDTDREEESILYETIATGTTADGRSCYKTTARSIHLATTQPLSEGAAQGYNEVRFFIAEAPEDNPTRRIYLRMACARVQYIKPSFKDPANGRIKLREDQGHFHDLADPATVQALARGQLDPCVEPEEVQ